MFILIINYSCFIAKLCAFYRYYFHNRIRIIISFCIDTFINCMLNVVISPKVSDCQS